MRGHQLLPSFLLFASAFAAPLSPDRALGELFQNKEPGPLEDHGPVFQGDMLGILWKGETEEQLLLRLKREGKSGVLSNKRWPNGRIPYVLDSRWTTDEKRIIDEAILHYAEKTAKVRFIPRVATDRDYVNIERGSLTTAQDCSGEAYVGRIGGAQRVFIQAGCARANYQGGFNVIVHELMHAAGFHHEQSRPDRDNYVDINWSNLPGGPVSSVNFAKYSPGQVTHYSSPYDFRSVMHYHSRAFAVNSQIWTIRPKPHLNAHISPYRGLSPTDVDDLNSMYS